MTYNKHHLKQISKGVIIEVILSGAAYVRLVDTKNFHRYKLGRSFDYWGGVARKSPLRFLIPESNRYFVLVDTDGIGGTVTADVQVIYTPAPADDNKAEKLGAVALPKKHSDGVLL